MTKKFACGFGAASTVYLIVEADEVEFEGDFVAFYDRHLGADEREFVYGQRGIESVHEKSVDVEDRLDAVPEDEIQTMETDI